MAPRRHGNGHAVGGGLADNCFGGAIGNHETTNNHIENNLVVGHNNSHNNNNSNNNNQCTTRCCTPTGECLRGDSLIRLNALHDTVKVICNNENCPVGQFMHRECFDAWEQTVLTYLKSCGRARSWSERQRHQNLWTKKGYDLAFKACGCRCGRGHLKKDLDWMAPGSGNAPGNRQDENEAKKKKRRNRQNTRPSLAVSAGPPNHSAHVVSTNGRGTTEGQLIDSVRGRAGSLSSSTGSSSPPATSEPSVSPLHQPQAIVKKKSKGDFFAERARSRESGKKVAPTVSTSKTEVEEIKSAIQRDIEELHNKFQNWVDEFQISSNIESLFGKERSISRVKPELRFTISCDYVKDICKAVIDLLVNDYGMSNVNTDVDTLFVVTCLQIYTKIWYANKGSQFASGDAVTEDRARTIKKQFPQTLYPILFYIEQIGRVTIDGQIMIPYISDFTYEKLSNLADELLYRQGYKLIHIPYGNRLTETRQRVNILIEGAAVAAGILAIGDGRRLTKEFLQKPNNFAWLGILKFHSAIDIISPSSTFTKCYKDLFDRITSLDFFKDRIPLLPIDFSQQWGTTAQLVTSQFLSNNTTMKVWSNRYVNDNALFIGGLFRYGHDLCDTHDCHSKQFSCTETTIETVESLIMVFIRNAISMGPKNKTVTDESHRITTFMRDLRASIDSILTP